MNYRKNDDQHLVLKYFDTDLKFYFMNICFLHLIKVV